MAGSADHLPAPPGAAPGYRRAIGGLSLSLFLLLFVYFYQPYALNSAAGTTITVCPFRNLTGLPCPGCGLTRSVFHVAHGDYARGLALYPFAPVFFIVVFLELANAAAGIARRGRVLFFWNDLFRKKWFLAGAYAFGTVVLAYDIWRIVHIIRTSSTVGQAIGDSIVYRLITWVPNLFGG